MTHRASPISTARVAGSRTPLSVAIAVACGSALMSTGTLAQTSDATPEHVRMETLQVEASPLGDSSTRYTVDDTRASTGLDLSPRETPQSVTSVTRQQLDDHQATTLEDALALTPGIAASKLEVGVRTSYRARGYDISNWKVDGLQFQGATGFSGGGGAVNMDLYERADIVRGANGLLGGTGDPSATVDLIRKRPGREFGGSAYASYGRWDDARGSVDVNLPLTEDGSVRSRFVVSQGEGDAFRDHESTRSRGFLANLEADVSEATTLGVGYQHEYNKTSGAGWGANVPIWFASGRKTDLSRSTNLAPEWSFADQQTDTVFASLTHRFNDDWSLNVQAAQSDTDAFNNLALGKVNRGPGGTYIGYWEEDGGGAVLNAMRDDNETRQRSAQIDLNGAFELAGRRHDLALGYSDSRTRSRNFEQDCTMSSATRSVFSEGCMYRATNGLPISDWRRGVDADIRLDGARTGRFSTTDTELRGLYAATRLSLTEPLSLILGGRTSYYKTDNETAAGDTTRQRETGVFTPYAGLVLDLTDNHSLYASYTNVFTPQTRQTVSGDTVTPIEGDSYEAGMKGEWFDGRLNASAAYFRTRQENSAVLDGANLTPDGDQAYRAGTGNETDGVDLEIAGALTPNWNVYGGYTYLHFRRIDSDGRSDPKHLFKLSTTYAPTGALNRWTFGAGVYAQSDIDAISSPAGQPTDGVSTGATAANWHGYATVNAMARYDITDVTNVTLNVDNLFDKHYYERYGFYAHSIYGAPRSAMVTLRTEF
ncbi:TonB-dependent siderophore receptor [Halomonas sp. 707D7]|uniref:TonB-dependent siderophore receptor n=3 Tax=unclassified Halomonas TaxID=2609666 RepID=UPI0020A1ACBF|nr:TonB-dependent siderophore receptor [Halomonas sp. 707D7]MCP1314123.1 TonB-dependent siderophore receptor [Halomonas sp. 707D7]